jgi:hypothetical protein
MFMRTGHIVLPVWSVSNMLSYCVLTVENIAWITKVNMLQSCDYYQFYHNLHPLRTIYKHINVKKGQLLSTVSVIQLCYNNVAGKVGSEQKLIYKLYNIH